MLLNSFLLILYCFAVIFIVSRFPLLLAIILGAFFIFGGLMALVVIGGHQGDIDDD